jgi:uncharacterized membrane protein YciS (DUF1049 family)
MKTKILIISALILGTIATASAQTAQNDRNQGFNYTAAQGDMSVLNKVSGENGG